MRRIRAGYRNRRPRSAGLSRALPGIFPEVGATLHRLTVAEMVDDLERIRHIVRDRLGAELVLTTPPVPLHTTFTAMDVRVANSESRSRIRAPTSELVDGHPDVHALHLTDVDSSWLTPIEKTAPIPSRQPPASGPKEAPRRLWRRAAGRVRRAVRRS